MQLGRFPRPATTSCYGGQTSPATRGLTNPMLTPLTPTSTNSNKSQSSFDTAIRTLEDIMLIDPDSRGIQFAGFTQRNTTPAPCGNNDSFCFEARTINGFDAVPPLSLHHTSRYAPHPFTSMHGSANLARDTSTPMDCSDSL